MGKRRRVDASGESGDSIAESGDAVAASGDARGDARGDALAGGPSWESLSPPLNDVVIKALLSQNKLCPFKIQSESFEPIMSGKNLIIKSPTGSGKTLAYLVPIVQKVLDDVEMSGSVSMSVSGSNMNNKHTVLCNGKFEWLNYISTIILEPTKELVKQTFESLKSVLIFADVEIIDIIEIPRNGVIKTSKPRILVTHPDCLKQICILAKTTTTTTKVKNILFFPKLKLITFDEADLMLNIYGYKEDLEFLLKPSISIQPIISTNLVQTLWCSATFPDQLCELVNVEKLDKIEIDTTTTNNLENNNNHESPGSVGSVAGVDGVERLRQFSINLDSTIDKFLCLYVFLKYNWLKSKILIFCNSSETSYKMKIFLNQFGISNVGIITPIQPYGLRDSTLSLLNRGITQILISAEVSEYMYEDDTVATVCTVSTLSTVSQELKSHDKYSSLSRGIDYQGINTIINFDVPQSPNRYTHRIGRAVRGETDKETETYSNATVDFYGLAITFVANNNPKDVLNFQRILDSDVNSNIRTLDTFNRNSLECFRYRVEDVYGRINANCVKAYRLDELKSFVSETTQKNPQLNQEYIQKTMNKGLKILSVFGKKPVKHLKTVPSYLDMALAKATSSTGGLQVVVSPVVEAAMNAKKESKQTKKKPTDAIKSILNQRGPIGKRFN